MESKESTSTKPTSFSSMKEDIKKLFPNLKIINSTKEMLGKTSVTTQIKPSQKSKEK
jgi:phage FluMu protein Com